MASPYRFLVVVPKKEAEALLENLAEVGANVSLPAGQLDNETEAAINIGVLLPIIMQIIQFILGLFRGGSSDGGTVTGPV